MASDYQKTAKDIAWDKERNRLKSKIFQLTQKTHELSKEIDQLNICIEKQNAVIEQQKRKIQQLEELLPLTSEELHLMVDEKQHHLSTENLLGALSQMNHYLGFTNDHLS